MNQKKVPTDLISESLDCRLSLYVSVFLYNACGLDGDR